MTNQNAKDFFSKINSLIFKDPLLVVLTVSLTINLLLVYYLILVQTTTLADLISSNVSIYNWLAISLTVLSAIFFGVVLTLLCWQLHRQKTTSAADLGNALLGAFLGAVSMGSPVKGAYLAEIMGIQGGLFIFPFQGLEIKLISLALLVFASYSAAKSILKTSEGIIKQNTESIIDIKEGNFILNINRKTSQALIPGIVGFALLFSVAFIPAIADKTSFYISFQKSQGSPSGSDTNNDARDQGDQPSGDSQAGGKAIDSQIVLDQINPKEGYEIRATYGDIGPKLLSAGAIDFNKVKDLYEKAGQPLTEEQIKILTQGSNEKIKITPENSYFLLNFLWAAGLVNKNKILDEGAMMQYGGKDQIGNFASTGGWTLGSKEATQLYSNFEIVKLTPQQQQVLEEFADNAYRPCCSNPTSFPDCNHGMAALALGEIMASQGATADEIFEAFKYVNSFWFPQTYFDIATYFKAKENKDWAAVSGRLIAGKDYSTPQGWQKVRQWLSANGYLKEAPSSGGGCGV